MKGLHNFRQEIYNVRLNNIYLYLYFCKLYWLVLILLELKEKMLKDKKSIFKNFEKVKKKSVLNVLETKVCSLLEWCFIISKDTCWDWFQRTYVLITAQKNF